MDNAETLKKFLIKCENDELRERTLKNNRIILIPFIEWAKDQEITDELILEYMKVMKKHEYKRNGKKCKYSDTTLYQYRSVLKKFLSYISPEMGKAIKLKMKKNREPPQILTPSEVEKLIDACLSNRDRALVSFLYESGCRKGEMVSIRIENVEFNEHGALITIPSGKTGSRTIQVVYSASYIRQWVDTHPTKGNKESPLFCSIQEPYSSISFSGLAHQLDTLKERAGITKKLYPHIFRHSRATHLAKSFTEQQLKAYLGWTQASDMAAVYVNLSQRDMENAVLKLHGLEIKDKEHDALKVTKCPRCKDLNPETSLYCGKCGQPLTDTAAIKLKSDESKIDLAFLESSSIDPAVLEILAKEVKKYIAENK